VCSLFVILLRRAFLFTESLYRKTLIIKKFAQKHVCIQCDNFLISKKMESEGRALLRLKYEVFENDLDFILDTIENYFNIIIDERDRELMS